MIVVQHACCWMLIRWGWFVESGEMEVTAFCWAISVQAIQVLSVRFFRAIRS